MFGAFRPSAPLSGGLLWKIPWRLSAPQKQRHRRRLRRVDNVVTVLDSALKRSSTIAAKPPTPTRPSEAPSPTSEASTEELAQTAEGQRLLLSSLQQNLQEKRHGRGPPRGDYVPETTSIPADPASNPTHSDTITLKQPSNKLLADKAREEKSIKLIERWKAEMPTEQEMVPRDKYTMFDKKQKNYRKGVHKLPKWTRMSQRVNPPGF